MSRAPRSVGKVDILVNGAGINSPSPFVEITDEEALKILDVNLVGVMRACQVFGNYFLSRDVQAEIAELARQGALAAGHDVYNDPTFPTIIKVP